jgi:hypothetical protein
MRHFYFSALLLAAACGHDGKAAARSTEESVDIKPTDFALVPCAGHDPGAPCVVVRAGGKRVMIGAPGGAGQSQAESDLAALDAVLLFSLQASDIEGLDEIRNRSLEGGRETPLPVSGPQGTRQMVGALNQTFAAADAHHLAQSPGLSQKNALLQAVGGERETKAEVFNTGDLVITHVQNAAGLVGYWVDYEGRRAIIEPCGMSQATQFGGEADAALTCNAKSEALTAWPLKGVLRVEPKSRPAQSGAEAMS